MMIGVRSPPITVTRMAMVSESSVSAHQSFYELFGRKLGF
jgi:hypothetical protein